MDNTSISKGVFINKGKYKIGARKHINSESNYPYPWYNAYKEAWSVIKKAAEKITIDINKQILSDLYNFVLHATEISQELYEIPTATLVTGVNLQDHNILFELLVSKIKDVTQYVILLSSRDCTNLKNILEKTIHEFIRSSEETDLNNYHTIYDLETWHRLHNKSMLNIPFVIVLPEFESINPRVLSDFILTLSYHNKYIKFVLIFGVATSIKALHATFSYNVISKLQIKVYYIPKQLNQLNDIIEGTMLTTNTSFKLIGSVVKLLADNFLYNELSVNGYLQSYKICMILMFFHKNLRILCCKSDDYKQQVDLLNPDDISTIQKYPSIAAVVEKEEIKLKKIIHTEDFKNLLAKIISNFHNYMDTFIIILKCLHTAIQDLPGNKLGSTLRQIYTQAVSTNITETDDYKQCINLLSILSKEELLRKLEKITAIVQEYNTFLPKNIIKKLNNYAEVLRNASFEVKTELSVQQPIIASSRVKFIQNLKMNSAQLQSPYKQAQSELINYLDKEIFSIYLKSLNNVPAYELFCFSTASVKPHIVGSVKGAIHKAATDPHAYLQCSCCKINYPAEILPTMLDLSIVYKLHMEHTKLINMYDWLQSFLSIVNPNEDYDQQRQVKPKLRARFTQAVADLEHLGFIKVSQKKVDHVKRLVLI